jgi:Protein of unknown function (DUF3224)
MPTAQGTFDVKMNPEPPYYEGAGVTLARATFNKTFHGELSGTSLVQFLSVRAGEHAAYVALERIEGTLGGMAGSFVVTHKALASVEAKSLVIEIVPGTGTGALAGIAGTMLIDIVDKQHFYTVEYSLPPLPASPTPHA